MFVYHQLQQFRQKKDNKGTASQGKSTKKSGKSEQREPDSNVESTVAKPTSPSSVPEGEVASSADSVENVAPDPLVVVDDLSVVPSAQEFSVNEMLMSGNELATLRAGDGELDIDSLPQNEGTDTVTADVEVARVKPLVDSDSINSGGETNYSHPTVPVDLIMQPASVDSTLVAVTIEPQSVDSSEDKSMPLQEDTPRTSLTRARDDQVTDIGCSLLLLLFPIYLCYISYI